MPHLAVLGSHYRVSSDDLALPSACALLARTLWVACCAALLHLVSSASKCGAEALTTYLSVAIALFCTSILIEVALIHTSRQGTIVQPEKRAAVGHLLRAHFVVTLLEFGCCLFGCLVLWNRVTVPCASDVLYGRETTIALLTVTLVSQLVHAFGLTCCLCIGRNKGPRRAIASLQSGSALSEEWAVGKWLRRQQKASRSAYFCSCSLMGGSRLVQNESVHNLKQLAENLALVFHHSGFLDLTPSDVAAGLLLLRLQQRVEGRASTPVAVSHAATSADHVAISIAVASSNVHVESPLGSSPSESESDSQTQDSPPGNLSPLQVFQLPVTERLRRMMQAPRRRLLFANKDDKDLLELVEYCGRYMWAIYAHFMYLYTFPVTGYCGLCYAGCCFSAREKNNTVGATIHGDRCCCNVNTTSMQFMLRHLRPQLLYSSFENDVCQTPFAVHHDEEKNRIVISVRGTFSLEDAVTDGKFQTIDLEELGKEFGFVAGKNRYGHGGFVEAAARICREIESKGVLSSFSGTRGLGQPGGMQLVVVGHSLGAAVASLVALFFSSKYPSNICFAYGLPSAVCDEATALELGSRVTAVGKDRGSLTSPPSLSQILTPPPPPPPPHPSRRQRLYCADEPKLGGDASQGGFGLHRALQGQQV